MKRSTQQNRAAHLYCRRLAQALRERGEDMRTVVTMPIYPTQENVWELLFKPVMRAMYPDKTSTTELSTAEMAQVAEVMQHAVAERLELNIPWPSEEEMSESQRMET